MTTNPQELLPCPFADCDGKGVQTDFGLEYPDQPVKFIITCSNGMHISTPEFDTAEGAFNYWNARQGAPNGN